MFLIHKRPKHNQLKIGDKNIYIPKSLTTKVSPQNLKENLLAAQQTTQNKKMVSRAVKFNEEIERIFD